MNYQLTTYEGIVRVDVDGDDVVLSLLHDDEDRGDEVIALPKWKFERLIADYQRYTKEAAPII